MAGAMFIQYKLNPAPPDPIQAKVFMILPLVMSVTFAFFPAGLVLYWVTNTVLSIAQQWNINRRHDRRGATGIAAGRRAAWHRARLRPQGARRMRRPSARRAAAAARRATTLRSATPPASRSTSGSRCSFPRRKSYTGEHVLELHGHGGPVVVEAAARRARRARRAARAPGEFTQRAFLNDKIDLAQAEAVADLIDAGSARGGARRDALAAGRVLGDGAGLVEAVTDLRAWVEAAIDFPEEEIDFLADRELAARLGERARAFRRDREERAPGPLLRDGMTVVIAGRPNAGKSSLLNRLAGYDAAIVTPVPAPRATWCASASTSTACRCTCSTPRACARTPPTRSRRRACAARTAEMARADRVLFVIDAGDPPPMRARSPMSACRAADRGAAHRGAQQDRLATGIPLSDIGEPARSARRISARTGAGLDLLRSHLRDCMGYQVRRRRALSAPRAAPRCAARARGACRGGASAAAQSGMPASWWPRSCADAQKQLGEITGEVTSEELLGRIFGSFCIGK
jgi:tRNA modification GTPase